jgi:hypothetical protein
MRAEFRRTRARLAADGVATVLRDFNVPACVYRAVADVFPENAFGLANFMSDCYFTDYAHPISERHTLEGVYPSLTDRVKPEACGPCVASAVCPGIPRAWQDRGYAVAPIDRGDYEREFPVRLLNQVLFAIVHDAVALRRAIAGLQIDWETTAAAFLSRLAGEAPGIEEARARVREIPLASRAQALIEHLAARGGPEAALARLLDARRPTVSAPADPPALAGVDA